MNEKEKDYLINLLYNQWSEVLKDLEGGACKETCKNELILLLSIIRQVKEVKTI